MKKKTKKKRMSPDKALEQHFQHLWENPPAPALFNQDFKPHAKMIAAQTTKSLEDEGWYDRVPLDERLRSGKWEARYNKLMEEYDAR